jgi:O-antigen/teichoic acid export membrane protein
VAAVGAATADQETLLRTGRSAVGVFGLRIAGAALAYLAQVLLARLMGRADYGIFATVWVVTTILGHLSLLGLGQAACRFIPDHQAKGEQALARGFIALLIGVSVGLAGVIGAVGAVLLASPQPPVGPGYAAPLLLACLVLPLFAFQDALEGIARGHHWSALAIGPPYVLRQAFLILAMAAAVTAGVAPTPTAAVGCMLAATAAASVVQAMALARRFRLLGPGGLAFAPGRWIRAALPMALVDLSAVGLSFADVVIVALFQPPEVVALYFAATRIAQLAQFVPYAASAVSAQRFAEARAKGDEATLRALARRAGRLTALATASMGLALAVTAPILLGIFGPGFQAATPMLLILIGGLVVQASFGPAEDLLVMLGRERQPAAVACATLALVIGLLFALVPTFGPIGAAAAMATAAVARGASLAALAWRSLGIATPVWARP